MFVQLLRRLPLLLLFASISTPVTAQNNGNGNNNGNNGPLIAGIEINAAGQARVVVYDQRMMAKLVAAQRARLSSKLTQVSESRKVSLNRLEQVIAERLRDGQPITDEMKFLAGLTRIENLYFFPDSQDIVIAGPAEGFVVDPSGRTVGINSGRSTLELQDLIVALRSFPPNGKKTERITVSIDPTKEGLARLRQFMRTYAPNLQPEDAQRFAAGLREALGQQVVTLDGVSPKTHFAQVLVEADYRMKLIGIGLEEPPVKIKSYVERANPTTISQNAMERWYFISHFDSILVSQDRFAMQMVGNGVKLIGENERVTAEGGRVNTAKVNGASQAFCKQFTEKFGELADRSPVYGQLRNLVAMSVVAAYIRENNFYSLADWNMETFGDESMVPVEIFNAPQQVATSVNVIWRDNTLMTPIGGGISVQPLNALSSARLRVDRGVTAESAKMKRSDLAKDVWWWD